MFFKHVFITKETGQAFWIFSALYYNNACIVFCATSAVLRQMVKVVSKAGRFLTIVCPSWLVFKECLHGHNLHRKPLFLGHNCVVFYIKIFFFFFMFYFGLYPVQKKNPDCEIVFRDGWMEFKKECIYSTLFLEAWWTFQNS